MPHSELEACLPAPPGKENALFEVCMEIRIRDFVAEIPVECLDFNPAPLQRC